MSTRPYEYVGSREATEGGIALIDHSSRGKSYGNVYVHSAAHYFANWRRCTVVDSTVARCVPS